MAEIAEKIIEEVRTCAAEGLWPSKYVLTHITLPDGKSAVYVKGVKPVSMEIMGRPAPLNERYWAVPVLIGYPDGSTVQGDAEVRVDEAAGMAVLRRFPRPDEDTLS